MLTPKEFYERAWRIAVTRALDAYLSDWTGDPLEVLLRIGEFEHEEPYIDAEESPDLNLLVWSNFAYENGKSLFAYISTEAECHMQTFCKVVKLYAELLNDEGLTPESIDNFFIKETACNAPN